VATLQYSPRPLADWLGHVYACLLDIAVPRLRRIALRNLSFALPELSVARHREIADGVFRSIGRLLVAFARFPAISAGNIDHWIRYEGFEHFTAARERGRGVLFATAHLGNWELSAFAHALLAQPMQVVVRPLDNRLIDRFVEQRRSSSGNTLIGKREFARPILKALRENQAVGILVDQNASADTGVFVPFFGVPACVNISFAKMAAHSGAAVIPGFAVWRETERAYILRFYPEVPITGDAAVDTAAIQHALELAIRQDPDQWLWIHRRWKTRPPGEPSRYNDL
jgi:KDO2-lipid IV(A) lauroyltransferase